MSRTIKDLPYPLWQCHRLGVRYPNNWRDYADWRLGPDHSDPAARAAWNGVMPNDPALGFGGKTRDRSAAANNALHEGRYRAYVRNMIRAGRWDDIEGPDVLTGYRWWY